jgi:hypothetical protein
MAQAFWTQKQHFGPAARYDHAMVFDSVRQQTLLFGGAGASSPLLGDTWGWDGDLWRQVSDIGPTPRARHAMAFDTGRGRTVLFGGAGGAGDTWEWDGALWTQVADTGPAANAGMAMAFHPGLKQVVLFGGRDGVGDFLGATWTWDGSLWTQVAADGPPPRTQTTVTYGADAQSLVLVGGFGAGGAGFGDTWTFDAQGWKEATDLQPGPVTGAALADAPGGPLLVGGVAKDADPAAGFGPNAGATWRFAQGKWTEVVGFGPPPRWRHACAFDSVRGAVVLFGGSATLPQATAEPPASPAVLGDTWEIAAGIPASVTISNLALSGGTLGSAPGSTLNAVVTLSASSSAPVPINAGVGDISTGQQTDPASVSVSQLTIPAGASQGTIVITRGPKPLQGPATLALAVQLGGSQQLAPFQA